MFFLAIGLGVEPAALPPVLPAGLALAAITAVTEMVIGAYAASLTGSPAAASSAPARR